VPRTEFPLHRAELYAELDDGDRRLSREMGEDTRAVAPRGVVTRAGEPSDIVYRLRTGWVARVRGVDDGKQQILAVFLPGELFGVKALLLERQPDGIEALSAATVSQIEVIRLRKLIAAEPAVSLRLMFQLCEEERRLHNWIVGLGRGDAEARIAAMLLDFHRRLHRRGLAAGDSFTLPMTQQQIGDFCGLTVVHVNRVLRRLREAGLVSIRQGAAILHDIAGLRALGRAVFDIYESEDAPS
jgi:CRP/FNR family transcriptional regulator, anaerobic regulatory protein